jgi:tetratricopeptide (TPR) repeat protein
MRCSKAQKLISEYIDHSLDPRKSLLLERHLKACSDCRELLEDFERIVGEAEELKTPSPSAEVWQKIKAGLSAIKQEAPSPQPQEKQKRERFNVFVRPFQLRYAWAAALVLVVIAVGVIFGLRQWRGKAIPGPGDLRYTFAKLEEAQGHYQKAIKALNEAIFSQKASLDPETAEVFQKNLEVIDASIKACQQVVSRDPNNIEARIYLLAVYGQKVNFLDEMYETKKSFRKKALGKTL